MRLHYVRRRLQVALARQPGLYRALLKLSGRLTPEKHVFLSAIKRGDVVFDIGANEGYFTLLFSDLVGPSGEVHAFEPVPRTFSKLQETVARNAWYKNVFLNHAACSEASGDAEVHVPGTDFGQASLRRHAEGTWRSATSVETYKVKTLALDQYFAETSLKRLDFVKCDVEGAEMLVLAGMGTRLRYLQPVILLEVFSGWTEDFGYAPADLQQLLRELGYSRFYLAEANLAPLANGCRDLREIARRRCVNLLCAPEHHSIRLPGTALDRLA